MFNSKILFITPSFYPATYYGGPIYSTCELAKALKKNGVDVKVITTNANGKEKLNIKTGVFHKFENELPVKYYNSLDSRGTSLSMILNFRKEIKNSDIVYLISIFSPPTPFTIFLCILYKRPLIISPRGQLGKWCLEQGNKFKKLWLHTFIQPYIAKLYWHLTSEEEKKEVLAIYPLAKTIVIPNGINIDCFTMNTKEKDRTFYNKYSGTDCRNKHIIISLSRIHKKKGYDILIEAFDILIKQKSDCLLYIAGEDFGEKSNLINLVAYRNLINKVFLLGHIEGEEKIKFLHNGDVFALPSHHENFGMVYAEALAAGTPIVASINTPWDEVEKHNCGKWVDNTPDKFAEAINEILNSDSRQMGINGSKYVEENFSWEKIGNQFEEVVKTII